MRGGRIDERKQESQPWDSPTQPGRLAERAQNCPQQKGRRDAQSQQPAERRGQRTGQGIAVECLRGIDAGGLREQRQRLGDKQQCNAGAG